MTHPLTTPAPTAPVTERSTAAVPGSRRARAAAVLRVPFVVSLVLFLLGGTALVVAQAVGMVAGDGAGVASLGESLGPWVFIAATVSGLLAFALEYLAPHASGEDA